MLAGGGWRPRGKISRQRQCRSRKRWSSGDTIHQLACIVEYIGQRHAAILHFLQRKFEQCRGPQRMETSAYELVGFRGVNGGALREGANDHAATWICAVETDVNTSIRNHAHFFPTGIARHPKPLDEWPQYERRRLAFVVRRR